MDIEESHWWLDIVEANLLDDDYCPAADDERHFKLAAIRRLRERNEELGNVLMAMDDLRDEIGKVIGKAK